MLDPSNQPTLPAQGGLPHNPWRHYYAQRNHARSGLVQGSAWHRRWPRLAVLASVVVVASVGIILVGAIPTTSVSPHPPLSALQHGGYTGTDCDIADLGSGSRTDPWPYNIGIPACAVTHYATTVADLNPTQPMTTASLARIDSRALFWAMLKRQDMQPISSTVHSEWTTPHQYSTEFPSALGTELVQIDYGRRSFVDESTDVNISTGASLGDDFVRCVNHESYAWSADHGWTLSTIAGPSQQNNSTCDRLHGDEIADSFSTDGIATGGLTATEADKFLSYLDHITGLITTAPAQAAHGSDGKTYVALDVQVTPQDPHNVDNVNPSINVGLGFFQAAFAQTGLSLTYWPYNIGLGPAQGMKIRYYLDPATVLPAYSVTMATTPIVTSGTSPFSPHEFTNTYTLNEYSYPSQLDKTNMQPVGTPVLPVRPWPFPQYTFG